jgi:hypothetical protein
LLAQRPSGDKQVLKLEGPSPAPACKPLHQNDVGTVQQELGTGLQEPTKEEKEGLAADCAEEITHFFGQTSHNGQHRPLLISDAAAEQKVSATFGLQEERGVPSVPETQEVIPVPTAQASPGFYFWSWCCNNKATSDEELNELKWSSGSY